MNKELFYQKMQPYFEQGMAREIYNSEHFSILSFGERVYLACPYILLENQPYGIYMNPSVMKKIVEKNRKIYPIINEVFSDIELNKDLIFSFDASKLDFWKKWIIENKNVNKIDYHLEEEIAQMSKNKSR